jgi:hypothetical protein
MRLTSFAPVMQPLEQKYNAPAAWYQDVVFPYASMPQFLKVAQKH